MSKIAAALASVFVIAAAAALLGAASTWGDNYQPPTLPDRICVFRQPSGGTVPVVLSFAAEPTAEAAADGAPLARWTERGRVPTTAALALYNAITIHDDASRPVAFTQPLSVAPDAGPTP